MNSLSLRLALMSCLALWHLSVVRGDRATTLAAVQRALGGADKLAAVTRLSLRGTLHYKNQAFGRDKTAKEQFIDLPFVTTAMLPDYFLERQDRGTNIGYDGFAKDVLLNRMTIVSGSGSARYPTDMVEIERAKCAYLMLPLLLRTDTAFHLLGMPLALI